jgi:hypothetical protein
VNVTQVAYVAGVIDSLARVRIRDTDDGTRLAVVAISSPKLDLLRTVAQLTGVRVVRVRRHYGRVGCTVHCDEPHLHVESDTGRWELVGARAVIVLTAVRPYLVTLADEVDAVLRVTRKAPSKPATIRKMHALGWEVAA